MISPLTGEIIFHDGLHLLPQAPVETCQARSSRGLPIPGWRLHDSGLRSSEYGPFEVQVVSSPDSRLCMVMLAHHHAFYEPHTASDGERRVFHEGLLARDLHDRREFPWGQVFCRFDEQDHRDRIVVAYAIGGHIPPQIAEVLLNLEEHARLESRSSEPH